MLKGFIAGLVLANGFEWVAHKFILHGTHRKGQARYSPVPKSMRSHWEHHREVRRHSFHDHSYVEGFSHWRTENEIVSLAVVAGVASAIFYPFSKGMAAAAIYSACNYYYVHRRSHLSPEWAKKSIPWHYDHHMNANQDANWCVTKPWFDYLLGTRVISSADLQEQNPLGITMPQALSRWLTQRVETYFPAHILAASKAVLLENQQRTV